MSPDLPDRRENGALERIAALEERQAFYNESRIEQRDVLAGIDKKVDMVVLQLRDFAHTQKALDNAHEEIRNLKTNYQDLKVLLERELPELRNVRRVVYGALGMLALAGVSAWGLLARAP